MSDIQEDLAMVNSCIDKLCVEVLALGITHDSDPYFHGMIESLARIGSYATVAIAAFEAAKDKAEMLESAMESSK